MQKAVDVAVRMLAVFCVDYRDVDLTQFRIVGGIEAFVGVTETGYSSILVDGGNVRTVVDPDETTLRRELFFEVNEGYVVDGKGETWMGVYSLDLDFGSGIGDCAGDIGFRGRFDEAVSGGEGPLW